MAVEFKVGDRVRIVEGREPLVYDGHMGVITSVNPVTFSVKFPDGDVYPFSLNQMEHVSFVVGDIVQSKPCAPENVEGVTGEVITVGKDYLWVRTPDGNTEMVPDHWMRLMPDRFLTGVKFDQGKPPISLVPVEAINGMAKAFAFGATKYEKHNFRKGFEWTRALDAAMRHTLAEIECINADEDSGLPHAYHALAALAMYVYFKENNVGQDDRFKKE